MNDKVAILMATYNGERYLEEQIESILNQTYQEFVLYIRDDGSTDNTKTIINKYIQEYPEKIVKVEDDRIAKGACKNFMCLLEFVHKLNVYDMFMFCDQDDYWLEEKIEVVIKKYKEILNKDEPILIHTDLEVVDKEFNIIDKSFIKYCNLKSEYNKFNNYLIQNNVTGCTTFINKKLVDLVNFDIQNIRMHDWYLALLASAFGEIIFINKSTIKYRQHENNVLGAKRNRGIKRVLINKKKRDALRKDIDELFNQAKSFKDNYYNLLNEKNKVIMDEFIKLNKISKIGKIKILIKHKFYKQNLISTIGEFIFI